MSQANEKVTIYCNNALAGLNKVEGRLVDIHYYEHGYHAGEVCYVDYIPKGGRRSRRILTFYSPFIMVVKGWKRPDPASAFGPAEDHGNGVSVSRARYMGTSRGYEREFLEANKFADGDVILSVS